MVNMHVSMLSFANKHETQSKAEGHGNAIIFAGI